jgi:hypothetical protein
MTPARTPRAAAPRTIVSVSNRPWRRASSSSAPATPEPGQKRLARPLEDLEHRQCRPTVDLDVLLEAGEVVDEGSVDHAVASPGASDEPLQVGQLAAVRLDPASGQHSQARIGACEPEHLMAGGKQFAANGGSDKTGRSGQEDTHEIPPRPLRGAVSCGPRI